MSGHSPRPSTALRRALVAGARSRAALLLAAALAGIGPGVAAEHVFAVSSPGYDTCNFAAAKLGVCFAGRKPDLADLDSQLAAVGIAKTYLDCLNDAVLGYFRSATAFLSVEFVPPDFDTVGLDLRQTGGLVHRFGVPSVSADLHRRTGVSYLLLLDGYSSHTGEFSLEAPALVGALALLPFGPKLGGKVKVERYIISHATWYALLDMANRKVVQHGWVGNGDQCGEVTADDWRQSIERLFDDIVSDGPLGAKK